MMHTHTTDTFKIAKQLNSYFINVAEQSLTNSTIRSTTVPEAPDHTAEYQNFDLWPTNQEVFKTEFLKPKTSHEICDEISSNIVKSCRKEVAHPLSSIINKSLTQGVFPSMLKCAKIHPKFK